MRLQRRVSHAAGEPLKAILDSRVAYEHPIEFPQTWQR
jgi:hypothetical protein